MREYLEARLSWFQYPLIPGKAFASESRHAMASDRYKQVSTLELNHTRFERLSLIQPRLHADVQVRTILPRETIISRNRTPESSRADWTLQPDLRPAANASF